MADWTSGYVADIGYTYGYYSELNPNRAELALLCAGFTPPSPSNNCELGFGQGLSINIHAAASGSTWYGTDFNPSQAAFARSLVTSSGTETHLTDENFASFCNRSDLPEFDFIGLHGIWSWISDQNREVIVNFLRKKLKVGGVLYISYNTLPGWATFAPMRHLMAEHGTLMSSPGRGVVSRVDGALEFSQKLLKTNPLFAQINPTVIDRLRKVSEQNRHYLAHEYFNKDWLPMHFSELNASLSSAKLSFACSANYLDHIDSINLTPEQQSFLNEIPDASFKESVRDFMVNQQFRKDLWVKGARKLSALEQADLIKQHKLVLTTQKENVSFKIGATLGEVNLNRDIYSPVLDLMSDFKIRSLGEIAVYVEPKGVSFVQLIQVAMVLIGLGHLESVQINSPKNREKVIRLNSALLDKARFSSDITYLASPITGGGIAVNRFQQLFILAINEGKNKPEDWANSAWDLLASQNQRLIKDGNTIDTTEGNLAELNRQAKEFADKQLPILKALQIL
jgi:SAM-dependent methyltransferase